MHRKRRVHIVDLVTGCPYFLHGRKQPGLIIETAYNKFLFCHTFLFVPASMPVSFYLHAAGGG
jgi:hypothetical protein